MWLCCLLAANCGYGFPLLLGWFFWRDVHWISCSPFCNVWSAQRWYWEIQGIEFVTWWLLPFCVQESGGMPLFQYFHQFHLIFMVVLSCLPFSLCVIKSRVLPLAFGWERERWFPSLFLWLHEVVPVLWGTSTWVDSCI